MANTIVKTGNTAPANIRASKSTSSTLLGTIPNGQIVNVVRCDATWATLQFNGTPAFIWNSLLENPPTTNGAGLSAVAGFNTAKCNANKVNIRQSTVNGSIIGTLNKGDNVSILGLTTGSDNYTWYSIGPNRWVRGDFLSPGGSGDSSGSGGSSGSGSVSNINTGDAVITTVNNVNFRSTPAGTSLGQMPINTTMVVTSIAYSGVYVWYKGTINGNTGYLRGDCVVKHTSGSTGGSTGSTTAKAGHYAQVSSSYDSVYVRAAASTSSARLGMLLPGTKLYCSEVVNDSWIKIIWGGMNASEDYVMSKFFVDGGVAPSSKKKRAIDIANSMLDSKNPAEKMLVTLALLKTHRGASSIAVGL